MSIISYLTLFSAVSFLLFGGTCFVMSQMKSEFKRYGLAKFRKFVGVLQLLGGVGLLISLFYQPILQPIAALGLSVLMLLGFLVRLKMRDSFVQAFPSFFYAILNGYIFYESFLVL